MEMNLASIVDFLSRLLNHDKMNDIDDKIIKHHYLAKCRADVKFCVQFYVHQ